MFAGWTKNVNTAFRGFVQKYLLNGLRTEDGWTILSGILASPSGTILTAYEQNVFVYACIKVIAENISSVPILLEDVISSENKTELVSGQVFDLMARPNIYQIDTDFINSVVSWWQYRGEAFIILERQQGASMFDTPDAMWTVDPQTVVPVMETDKNGRQRIIGWNTHAGAETIFVSFQNMIHLTSFSPQCSYRGFSPTLPAQMSIDNDYYASQFNKKFFENGAQMAGILITKEELSDDSYKRLLDTFNDRHQGVNKSHKVGLLEAGVDFKSLNFSHKDMDFVGLKDRSKQEICVTWKVNEVVLGEYANIKSYEGINACHRTFWHECLLPKMRYVEKVLNAMLFSRIMGAKGKYVFSFDKTNIEALKEDLVTKTMVGQFFINWGWTPNQVNTRLRLNLPKLPWGDSALIQNNRIPVGSKKELSNLMPETNPYGIGNPEPGKEIAPKEPTKNMFDGTVKALSNLISKLDNSNTKTNSVYDNYIRVEESLEKRLREKLRNYFYQQRKQVLNNFYDIYGSKANKADDYVPLAFEFADNVEIQKLVGILRPFYTEALQSGADMVIAELGKEGQADVFADSFQDWVAAKLDFTPKEIVSTVKNELGKLVSSGLADKLETSEIASMIKTFYNTVGNNNSFTIARTEMAAAVSAGRFSEMSLQGVKKHKWVTEKDGRVRETHKLLEGAIANIGEAFKYSNGSASPLRYPGDSAAPAEEVVNCRCIAVIVS